MKTRIGKISEKNIRIILLTAMVLLNIKYIFADFGIDAEFQITMSYRILKGDKLFLDMWEPYQMSTFLCALFAKIYLSIFKTTTGIVLYMQVIGVLLDGCVAWCTYYIVSKYVNNEKAAFVMAWLIMIISPKDVPLADYANMQLWFSVLLALTLFMYSQSKKKRWLFLSACSLSCAVLSYPSCILLAIGVVLLLLYLKDWKAIIQLFSICICFAALYLGIIFTNISIDEFFDSIYHMLKLETSHSAGIAEKLLWYAKQICPMLVTYLLVYGISYGLIFLIRKKEYRSWCKTERRLRTDKLFFCILLFVCFYSVIDWKNNIRYSYSILFPAVMLIGFRHRRVLSKEKFYFYLCGTVIAILQFISTAVLTNLQLIASVPYLMLGLACAVLPIAEVLSMKEAVGNQKKSFKAVILLGALFFLFRNAYLIRPLYGHIGSIFRIGGIVKSGPALGIVTDYMGAYMQNETIKEWEAYVEDGDSIYLIGSSLDTLGYLYKDTVISAPTLVPTPGYNESLLAYWDLHPEKYPDIIIASCWYGNLNHGLSGDNWIMKWIEEEYQAAYYIDGKYWRYYYRDNRE